MSLVATDHCSTCHFNGIWPVGRASLLAGTLISAELDVTGYQAVADYFGLEETDAAFL